MKSIIIAAPQSGSGKTTVTIGIMECLRRRGLTVAPFKTGPDFIDPGYHRLVTGRPSVNLDGWMCGEDFVRETFACHCAGADVAVVEGVMGLFDGIGAQGDEGSTAQVARLTGSPVILVVDAGRMAGSAAALVKGFAQFDPRVRVAAVIFNNVGSDNHGRILMEAMTDALPAVRVLGCVGRDDRLHIPSRHLGLTTAEENPLSPRFLDHLAERLNGALDFECLLNLADSGCPLLAPVPAPVPTRTEPVPIAVARDEAFCFVYEDNLRLLRESGVEIVEFSPLRDAALPAGIGGIYLPGGYPELFAATLAANGAMKEAICGAVAAGMPVYAECGGFIYLTAGMVGADGALHDFVGVFPVTTRMLPRRKALGYREIVTRADSILGRGGCSVRGHEFHYSETAPMPEGIERLYRVRKQETELGAEGYRHKNCLASYIHLHFGSCPGLAEAFAENCRKFKGSLSDPTKEIP
ncbi:cobyrinate a,c-diamide synthase [Geotalea sp. SG265]|uniref:cobyrinate a,c-diamide synthase n=1 Tax=Geotalea sp. SG265 TaxID=2922867 RepID=UPI001FAFC901|nr:cobyrinate a,c-diamide synthase [Geotalea sp. SG265]